LAQRFFPFLLDRTILLRCSRLKFEVRDIKKKHNGEGGNGGTTSGLHRESISEKKYYRFVEQNSGLYLKKIQEDDFNYGNNVLSSSQEVQKGFLRKVYGILTVQVEKR